MAVHYKSGEVIRQGDNVTLNGNSAVIELVADPESPTAETTWHIEQYGAGALIKEPQVFGRVFLTQEHLLDDCDDLQLVSRAETGGRTGFQ